VPRPTASIIVPLSGGPAAALRCFEGIAAQADEPLHEIIVVDDASVGLEPLLARLAGDVDVLRLPTRRGFAAAVRAGVGRAQGEFVVVLRDAAVPALGWLSALCRALKDPRAAMATSVTGAEPATSPVAAWSAAVRATDLAALDVADVDSPLVFASWALALAQRGRQVLSAPAAITHAPSARTVGMRQPVGSAPELTVVIPTLDAASERVRSCIAAVQANTDCAHEIVIVDNGSPPQGFAAPVNAGLRAARTPYVVVMNDDVEPLPGWWAPLRAAIDAGATVAFPLTIDGGMRYDFPAWCFAMGEAGVARFSHAPGEFFDPELVVWYQDTDLLHRLRETGTPPVLAEASQIRHGLSQTVMSEDPELSAWIQAQVARDRERFVSKHPGTALKAA
jgi:GT2 family glycosyltransferase